MDANPTRYASDSAPNLAGRGLPAHEFELLKARSALAAFDQLVEETYRPLRFLDDQSKPAFLPSVGTNRYGLYVDGILRGICALNSVTDVESPFHQHLSARVTGGRRMIEVNNVILARDRDPGPWLTVLLYRSVREAIRLGFDLVVGITRFQTLKYFIDSGATPVYHPPLHLLGREDLNDFIIYFDAANAESVDYLLRHIPRTIDSAATYARIKNDFVKRVHILSRTS